MKVFTKVLTKTLPLGKILVLFGCTLAFCTFALAISEKPHETYPERFSDVMKFYEESGIQGSYVLLPEKKTVSFHTFNPGKEIALVMIGGQANAGHCYAETIYDLLNRSSIRDRVTIYLLEPPGQGSSDRMTTSPHLQHIDSFDRYVASLDFLMEETVKKAGHRDIFFLGESMGGTIGLLWDLRHPSVFSGIALSSPMLGIESLNSAKYYLAKSVANMHSYASWFVSGLGSSLTPLFASGGEFVSKTAQQSGMTSSEIRQQAINSVYEAKPGLKIGGVSYGWVVAAGDANYRLINEYRPNKYTLVFQAGLETVVDNLAQDSVFGTQAAEPWVRVEKLVKGRHLLLRESDKDDDNDSLRDRIMDLLEKFLFDPRSVVEKSKIGDRLESA